MARKKRKATKAMRIKDENNPDVIEVVPGERDVSVLFPKRTSKQRGLWLEISASIDDEPED